MIRMGIMYTIGTVIGFLSIPGVFFILSMIFAKKKAGWVLWWIGAALYGIVEIGELNGFGNSGNGSGMTTEILLHVICGVLLTGIALVVILLRRKKAESPAADDTQETDAAVAENE